MKIRNITIYGKEWEGEDVARHNRITCKRIENDEEVHRNKNKTGVVQNDEWNGCNGKTEQIEDKQKNKCNLTTINGYKLHAELSREQVRYVEMC